jgi:hypothetical protein
MLHIEEHTKTTAEFLRHEFKCDCGTNIYFKEETPSICTNCNNILPSFVSLSVFNAGARIRYHKGAYSNEKKRCKFFVLYYGASEVCFHCREAELCKTKERTC